MSFTFRGCKFHIGIPFLSFVTGTLILDNTGKIMWCLLATFIHELGHIICMLYQRKELREIRFCLFDIKIIDDVSTLRSYGQDMVLMVSGPIANFFVALVFYAIGLFEKVEAIEFFVYQNLILGTFNLLPIESLDGGQFLLLLLRLKFEEQKAMKILNVTSILTLFPIEVIGFYLVMKSKYNISLLLITIYLLIRIVFKENISSR